MSGALAVLFLVGSGPVRSSGSWVLADEVEPDDAPLPEITPEALAKALEAAWKPYEAVRLEVEFEEERESTPYNDEGANVSFVKFPGRIRYASDGRSWRAEFDSKTLSYRPDRVVTVTDHWVTGFDGTRHYNWEVGANEVTFGDSNRSAANLEPRALFWNKSMELIQTLKDRAVTISQKSVDGVRCYDIQARTKAEGKEWLSEYGISPRRSYLGVETAYFLNGQRYYWHRLRDLRPSEQGSWAPGRIDSEWSSLRKSGPRLESRRAMRVVRFEPSKPAARDEFALTVPVNATVNDLTTGSQYLNDPWHPEVSRLLRERFNWPPTDFSRLQDLTSDCDDKLEGQPAPPVEASLWINSGPIDWTQTRGKVVLIHFTSMFSSREAAAAIRDLAKLYEKDGLRVVTVVGRQDAPEAVRQYGNELHLENPVAIDRPNGDQDGATMQAFGMSHVSTVVLIDHRGKVRLVKARGGLLERVVELLREAGAGDVAAPDPNLPHLTPEKSAAVQQGLQDWMTRADGGGSLFGTIVDADGMPVAGALVRVTAEARILMRIHATFTVHSRSPQTALTGEDGLFQLRNLGKGNYNLQVSAPGFATIARNTLIEPGKGEVKFDAVMSQADVISGRVADEEGRPIADAKVTLSDRQVPHEDGRVTFYGFLEMKTTDAQGRFQFHKLSEGNYTLTSQSEGFSKLVSKNVPAGANNLELKLPRVRP